LKLAKLYFEAAEAYEHPQARNELGLFYYNEAKDYRQAAEWFHLAIEKGCPYALTNLGLCYEKGHGVEKNTDQALTLYKQSVEQGNPSAMYPLGYLYLQKAEQTRNQG
jgi:TPR repeat protein